MKEQQYILKNAKSFELKDIFDCGQCFRWNKESDESYTGVFKQNVINVKKQGQDVYFKGICSGDIKNVVTYYFDLERDYKSIKQDLLSHDNTLKEAIETMSGVRILNQEFFETLISFIISQNKQIPHIKKIVSDISTKYGNYLGECNGVNVYAFPTLEQMSGVTVEDLKELKTGFRAPYIVDAVQKVKDKTIDEAQLRQADVQECEQLLTQIKGVGAKVANCTMLFGLGKTQAFPVDVWIKRIMEHLYFNGEDTPKEKIAEFAKERFGEYGGYAQQYLFYYGKTIKMGVKKSK